MNLVIDPDVFEASRADPDRCGLALRQAFYLRSKLQFVVDIEGTIQAEYHRFVNKYKKITQEEDDSQYDVAIELVRYILNPEKGGQPLETYAKPSKEFQNLLQLHFCDAHKQGKPVCEEVCWYQGPHEKEQEHPACLDVIESELLAMGRNFGQGTLVMLLAGIQPPLHRRVLLDDYVCKMMENKLGIEIYFASDTKVITSFLAAHTEKELNSRLFEYLIKQYLQTENENLRFIEMPAEIRKFKSKRGRSNLQVDAFGVETSGEDLIIWIGECKLYSGTSIPTKDVKQLDDEYDVVYQWLEEQINNREPHKRHKVLKNCDSIPKCRRLMITTAHSYEETLVPVSPGSAIEVPLEQFAKELEIEFWKAEVNRDRKTNLNWRVTNLKKDVRLSYAPPELRPPYHPGPDAQHPRDNRAD